MNTKPGIHPFEAAGLGLAPFRYVGVEFQEMTTGGTRIIGNVKGIQLETKPGGTCAYCGTYILNMYNIQSSDGKRFHVGCDCVLKTADSVLIKAVNEDKQKATKARKAARNLATINAATAKLPEVRGTLAEKSHPNEYLARQGKTLLDWIQWMMENAGTSGRIKAAEIILNC